MEDAPDTPEPPASTGVGEAAPAPEPAAPATPAGAPAGRAVWWEVAAVLAVGVAPNLIAAAGSLCRPAPPAPLPYWLDAFQLAALSACTIFVTLYLIARSGESWEHFGLARPRLLDAPLGAFMLLLAVGVWRAVPHLPDDGPQPAWFLSPQGPGDYVLMVVQYALSAFAEELVTRAYLVTRLTKLLHSRGEAVVAAALLFASYHAYQGLSGAVDAFVFGLLYGVMFLTLGRIWPLALGHALFNMRLEILYG